MNKKKKDTGYKPVAQKKKVSGTGLQPVTSELKITRRNLPHWQQGGATYFLTFNTKGIELNAEDRRIVQEACLFWQGKKWRVLQMVVMPDHVHLLVTPLKLSPVTNRWHPLGEIVHSVKRFSARAINQRHSREGALWWDESYDRLIRNEKEFSQKWEYIRMNPIKAGLAREAEEYEFYWATGFKPVPQKS